MVKRIAIFILFATIIMGCSPEPETKKIVFVCTHGAARSPIAAAYFNKLAKEKNLNYHAIFRATEPDEALTKGTITGLSKDGFVVSDWKPQQVTVQDIENAHTTVAFDCMLPAHHAPSLQEEQWNGTPPISKDYDAARNVIKEKVKQLIESLDTGM